MEQDRAPEREHLADLPGRLRQGGRTRQGLRQAAAHSPCAAEGADYLRLRFCRRTPRTLPRCPARMDAPQRMIREGRSIPHLLTHTTCAAHNLCMGETTMPAWECDLCGWIWPKRQRTPPVNCPACGRRLWNGSRARRTEQLAPPVTVVRALLEDRPPLEPAPDAPRAEDRADRYYSAFDD